MLFIGIGQRKPGEKIKTKQPCMHIEGRATQTVFISGDIYDYKETLRKASHVQNI